MSDSFPLFGEMRWNSCELAEALLLTPQRICQLSKEHVLPQASGGLYTPVESVASYIRYLRQREAGKSQAGEAAKKVQLENAMREIKLRKIAGELVEVDRVARDWFEVTRRVRDTLLNLPSRLSGPFAAESDQARIFDLFSREINQVLTELSSRKLRESGTVRGPLEVAPDPAPSTDETGVVEEAGEHDQGPTKIDREAASKPARAPDEHKHSTFEDAFLDRGAGDPADRFSTGD